MDKLEFSKKQKLVLFVLIGFSLIGLSFSFARAKLNHAGDVNLCEPEHGAKVIALDSDNSPQTSEQPANVVVHVTGCVKSPGVYTLLCDKRTIDAINSAGGPTADADLQVLNLAAKLSDGARIFVPPAVADAPLSAVNKQSKSSSASGSKLKVPGEGTVSINSATIDDLQRLPGVGPSTAQKIIDYRTQIGNFTSAEQLIDVKGIGPKTFEKMRPFVTL